LLVDKEVKLLSEEESFEDGELESTEVTVAEAVDNAALPGTFTSNPEYNTTTK